MFQRNTRQSCDSGGAYFATAGSIRNLAVRIPDGHAVVDRSALQPFRVTQGARRVVKSRLPVLPHRRVREFVVFDVPLVFLVLIDQLDDVDVALDLATHEGEPARDGGAATTAFPTSFDPRPDCCIVRPVRRRRTPN